MMNKVILLILLIWINFIYENSIHELMIYKKRRNLAGNPIVKKNMILVFE